MPMILGRRIFWHSAAMARPKQEMNARDVTFSVPPLYAKKADAFLRQKITEVISFVSGFRDIPGENFIPEPYYTAVFHVCKQELLDFSERKLRAGRE